MDHEMKIDKSRTYCKLGDMEESFNAVVAVIPECVLDEVTAKSLGKLIDSIWTSWQETKKIHEKDILAEGAIYDPATGKMVELCQN